MSQDFVASTALVNDVLVAVTKLPGSMFWRANSGLLFARSGARVRANVNGTPDIIGAYRGRPVGIECKYGSGRLNANQKMFRDTWQAAGGVYITGHSPEQVIRDLGEVT